MKTMTARDLAIGSVARVAVLMAGLLSMPHPSGAQTCGSDYVIQQGDSLAQIASRVYGNSSQWTIILYANQDRLGPNASLLVPGLSIKIPCVGGAGSGQSLPPVATTPAQQATTTPPPFLISSLVQSVELLTGDGLAPFTGRSLPNGGMMPHLITAALDLVKESAPDRFSYRISWVNDWSAHLNPLLSTRAFDAGFPWTRPDCDQLANLDADDKYRCQRFFFSDPLFEDLTHIFVRKESPIKTGADEEMAGKSLCRPAGYEIYEIDQDGRNWVKEGKIVLIRPQSVDECFRLLDAGTLDAVAVTDMVGLAAAESTGVASKVRMIDKPLAIRTMHVVVSKGHPNARTVLYYVNSAIGKLKESGAYDRIVGEHLRSFWEPGSTQPTPASTSSTTSSTTQTDVKEKVPASTASTGKDGPSKGASAEPSKSDKTKK